MRSVFLALALLVAGCGPEFAVIPRNGQERIQAQAPMGISITALAEQWHGDPGDLADYVTPILVELSNPGPYEVRVSLADFALRDDQGTRYQAINPFIPAVLGETDPRDTGVMLASRGGGVSAPPARGSGGGGGGRAFFAPRSYNGRGVIVGPPPARRYGYGSGGLGWGGGFFISPGLRGWYGPGYAYWDYPFIRPPYYWDWVYWWGPGYYPSARPSADVLGNALPEGVLPPNSRIAGFLYFKKATGQPRRDLDLSWELREARNSNDLGSLHVPLVVVHND
jgi:hypothetical protein